MSLSSHSTGILDPNSLMASATTTKGPGGVNMWPPPTASSTTTEDSGPHSQHLRLSFDDFLDLQTRLVLLPRVEEEGRGAVIASYHPKPETAETTTHSKASQSHPKPTPSHQNTAEPSKEHRDDDDTTKLTKANRYSGYILLGAESKQEEWVEKDFTEILSLLREEPRSVVLVFAAPQVPEPTSKPESAPAAEASQPEASAQDQLQSSMMALSKWGMRMRAQATVAATNISSAAKERAKQFQTEKENQAKKEAESKNKPCQLFLQTPVGAFLPVSLAQSKVTTSSLLIIRKSAIESVPPSGWSYQWYRSSSPKATCDDDASLDSGSPETPNEAATPEEAPPVEIEWTKIEGASSPAFQPDTTLIGLKLRCVVTVRPEDPCSSDDSDNEVSDQAVALGASQEVVCELDGVVSADLTLFNGARQALVRGAKFGGLKGRGNASGRNFRVEISIGMPAKKRSRTTTSSLQIFQISGQESISHTPEPILGVSARASASHPKHLDLQISVSDESVLSALCTDGYFQIETPNRISRESFLLALGIANYSGKPANLDAQTILYQHECTTSSMKSLMDDDASSTSSSCAPSLKSHAISQGPVTPAAPSTPPQPPRGLFISPIQSVTSPDPPTPFFTPASPNQPLSSTATATAATPTVDNEEKVASLEQELNFLRAKLKRKDKVVSELQRQIAQSDAAHQQTQQTVVSYQQELKQSKIGEEKVLQSLQKAEKQIQAFERKVLKMESDQNQQVSTLEARLEAQSTKIGELEKANKSLQNEKAVLQAAVGARESRLSKMGELQTSFEELSVRVSQHDALRQELETSNKRYEDIQNDLRKVEEVEKECRFELASAKSTIDRLTSNMQEEQEKAASCHSQLDTLQKKIQQLKGERNSFKQKNDSLSKEVARLCRNGKNIGDVEKILSDHQLLVDEVETLRKQKRKAMEDAHLYRTSYEQAKSAQQMAGVDVDTRIMLERNVELERLLAETTEYVNAKEMQLETMKLVNDELQKEIHTLARAHFGKNEV